VHPCETSGDSRLVGPLHRGSRGHRTTVGYIVVNWQDQPRFREFDFNEALLNLHRHCGDMRAKRLIIFVHGLGGNGYNTWRKFPQFVFDDLSRDPVDVALFDYFSGHRRRTLERPKVPVIAEILTERLQELSKCYDEIFIVAHSMGGLIAIDALRNYIRQRKEEPGLLRVLAGAIFIATPFNGSRLAEHPILRELVSESEQLAPSSAYQQDLRQFINDNIDTKNGVELTPRQYKLPLWAIVGGLDRIVDRSSATFGIDDDQVRTAVNRGHTGVAKPQEPGSQVVTWVRDMVDETSSLRTSIRDAAAKARRASLTNAPSHLVLVEFFLEADANDSWQPIYESVVQSAGSTLVQVEDRFISDSRFPPNLLISAHRSHDLIARRTMTRLKVEELRKRYDEGGAHARAITVGPNRALSMKALSDMARIEHEDNQPYRLIFGSADNDEQLQLRLHQSVAEIVKRQHIRLSQDEVYPTPGQPLQIAIDREEPWGES
jgi:pimeloyl-ACP methyl ester carboxylesterase